MLIGVLENLSRSSSIELISGVPAIAGVVPDEPRLVPPLWRCLSTPGIENTEVYAEIVKRLVVLCMRPDCFDALNALPSYFYKSIGLEDRLKAFPFRHGAALDSNFVSLITLAARESIWPSTPCTFIRAKLANSKALTRVERDRRWTVKVSVRSLRTYFPVLTVVISALLAAATFAFDQSAIASAVRTPMAGVGAVGLLYFVTPSAIVLGVSVVAMAFPGLRVERDADGAGCLLAIVSPPLFFLAALIFAGGSLRSAIVGSVVASYLLTVFPATKFAHAIDAFYVPSLNPYLQIYDDETCRHWITRDVLVGVEIASAPSAVGIP